MRVVLIGGGVEPIPPTGYGAIERILTDFQAALTAAGHTPIILNRVRHRKMRDEYPFALELPRLLREIDFDVLHANTPVVANRLVWSGRRFAYTSHSRHWYYRTRWTHRWGYWLERRAVRRSTAVVALTEPLARTMRSAVSAPSPLPITVIPFGVDSVRFAPDWSRRDGARALGVGVVLPFKRWEAAARALRGTGIRLQIAGPQPSPEYAAAVRAAGDSVELLGEVDDARLRALFAESDFLVHPSAVEVLSATVLQGLAAGLPVLGGGAVDGVVEDGRTGWVLDDRDPTGFAAALRARAIELRSDEGARRTMGEAARAVAVNRYSWTKVVAAHLPVYRAVAGG
ncbi:MAG: glycosyltransferase family 4 protein [Thermoplasmata archaeon]|nr:glycosyltransferase family 4 protein [Thermoplasmata archaeon]